MANFTITVTNAGLALLTGAVAGDTLTFTGVAMGSGAYSGSLAAATALVAPKLTLPVSALIKGTGQVTVKSVLTYNTIETGFTWTEIGLYAKDPDGGTDILYAYGCAGDKGDYIPSKDEATLTEKVIRVTVMIGNAANVTAQINGSTVYASQEKLEYLEQLVNLINNTATYKIVFDFTVPVETWTKVSETDRYGWKAEVANEIISQDHIPDVTLDSASMVTAFEAGVSTTAETSDGKLCLWSQARPTAEISGSCTLWGGSNGGTTTSGGGVVPIASYDRLGIVQISSGLNITEAGALSVSVATDEEVDAMLAEIYGEERTEV